MAIDAYYRASLLPNVQMGAIAVTLGSCSNPFLFVGPSLECVTNIQRR